MRGCHDIGGLDAGPIDRSQHDYAFWEKRVDAILMLLAQKGLISNDETRLGIEALGAEQYERLTYYEKWLASVTQVLLARGLITADELGRRMAEIGRRAQEAE